MMVLHAETISNLSIKIVYFGLLIVDHLSYTYPNYLGHNI